MISIFSSDKIHKVYNFKDRRSDKRDPMEYGRDYDSSQDFFQQLGTLYASIPQASLYNGYQMENCDYCNYGFAQKNCYMNVGCGYCENSCYCRVDMQCNYDFDGYLNVQSEHCYNSVRIAKCYQVFNSVYAEECRDSSYLYNCKNCQYCLGCVNIIGGQHMVLNQKCSKEEYEKTLRSLSDPEAKKEFMAKYDALLKQSPRNHVYNVGCEKCLGNDNNGSSDLIACFDVVDAKQLKYCAEVGIKYADAYDMNFSTNTTMCYECVGYSNHKGIFCGRGTEDSDLIFCIDTYYSSHCIACVGIKHKKYCILNKQYTQEEYEKLAGQIIENMIVNGSWGEFFPASMTPFCYNETLAHEYFPLTRIESAQRGYSWMDNEVSINIPNWAETIQAQDLPTIQEATDDITEKIIICEVSWRPFRIIKQELEFFRKQQIALPTKHPDIRHQERLQQRPSKDLFMRNCDSCNKEILSVYPSSSAFKIYCGTCYDKEMYW